MRLYFSLLCFTFTVLYEAQGQLPPRLSIPGALLASSAQRPSGSSRSRSPQPIYDDVPSITLRRKPSFNSIQSPIRETRPVIEEPDDVPQSLSSAFDDEVAKLGIGSLQSAINQAANDDQQEEELSKPFRPVPVLRQDVRESISRPAPIPQARPAQARPAPIPQPRPAPVRQAPLFRENLVNVRQSVRQEPRDEEENIPIRRPQAIRPSITQEYRAPIRAQPVSTRQQVQYEEDDHKRTKNRKPPVQILRKFRTDNEDGSITWGYENEDGTFKEETIGVDCIVRGKYGYTDPDGVRREYTYEAGGVCEEIEEELPLEPGQPIRVQGPPKGAKKLYRLPA